MKNRKLRGRIVEKFGTFEQFANALGISRPTLSLKLGGRVDWSSEQIEKAIALLDLKKDDIGEYFFN